MNKNKILIFGMMALLLVSGYILIKDHDFSESRPENNYEGEIEFETTVIGYQPLNKGVQFKLFNVNQQDIYEISIPSANKEQDFITPIQNHKGYFLIQSTEGNITDKIIDLEKREVKDLGWRGHSVAAENEDTILLAKYMNNRWALTKYDKMSGDIKETIFQEDYPDSSGVRVHHGLFNNNKWYIPYSSSQGTFTIILDENKFSKIDISRQELSDLWIIDITNDGFTFYNGYVSAPNADSVSFMDPKLNKVNIKNGVVNITGVPITNISNNAYCLGFYKNNDSKYLMLFQTQGKTKLETILVDSNGKSEKVFTSSEMNIQSVKIGQSVIAVANSNEAVFVDPNGKFVKELKMN